ncbi:MAG: 2,3-diaminopropionate biosynthesis protein SbnB [Candidatus Taylorbacteria bacterium]|nr:2,3-diaminopropionate biosynthesis protein SbnB [Candidatus Taylorbacteria bacterium]
MIYLNTSDIEKIGIDWKKCLEVIKDTVVAHCSGDTVQPIKPYLRFDKPRNRIIAMPAYVGAKTKIAGIKWIASFPENIKKGIPRASSVTVLNDAQTGQVVSIINTSQLSVVRTVSVSALVIDYFVRARHSKRLTVGIIGFGPIGTNHLKMCESLYGNIIEKIFIYDIDKSKLTSASRQSKRIHACSTWQEAYVASDIVITCTVSSKTYIDQKPKDGSLLLNVSLRDYTTTVFNFVKNSIIVDDWNEVCRENTDIEIFHKEKGLEEKQVKTIDNVVINDCIAKYSEKLPIMFNPMGMAMFDIAIAKFYLNQAREKKIGLTLD